MGIIYYVEAVPEVSEQIAAFFGPDLETREKVCCKDGVVRNFYIVQHEFIDKKLRSSQFARKRFKVFVSRDEESPEPMSILERPRTPARSSSKVRGAKKGLVRARSKPVSGAVDEEEGDHPTRR